MSNPKEKNNEFHFEVPFDVLPLPSGGLLYPGQKDSIKVEFMTAADENILTSPNLIKSGKVIDVLIERKIKKNVKFKLLTVGDERELVSKSEKRTKLTKSPITNLLTSRLEKQIVEIDGNRDPNYISRYIQVMPAYDSLQFRKYNDDIEPGIDMMVDVEGPSGESFRSTIPIGLNFFWPNAQL